MRRLVDHELAGRAGVPWRDRGLSRFVERLHGPPHRINPVGEQVAYEQVGDRVAQLRVLAHERTEAEAVVELAHEPPHAIDSLVEIRSPSAQLRLAEITPLEAVHDGLRRELSGL